MTRPMRFWLVVALVVWPVSLLAAEAPLTVSTLPFADSGQQKAIFGFLNRHLENRLGRAVRFVASDSYDEVLEGLARGKVDVAFLGAAAYVSARRRGGVRAILRSIRENKSTYRGVVFVKKDSGIRRLAQLRGKSFAFVDPLSTGGYLFPSEIIRRAGVDPKADLKIVFAGAHHKVANMVANGEVVGGACIEGALANLVDRDAISVIGSTDPIPGDPVVVRAGLGVETVNELRSALIDLGTLPEARTFFTYSEIDGFVPALDSDYDQVAELLRRNRGG